LTIETLSHKPSPAKLIALASTINEAISQYSLATSQDEQEIALRVIDSNSQNLSQYTAEPRLSLMAFHFQPHKVLCVRLAVEMGLFDHLPTSATFAVETMAKTAGTDLELTRRVVRGLSASNIFEEVAEGIYKQTALSHEWNSRYMQSYAKHSWDNVISSMSSYLDFYQGHRVHEPL
jgi:hypothetical protein